MWSLICTKQIKPVNYQKNYNLLLINVFVYCKHLGIPKLLQRHVIELHTECFHSNGTEQCHNIVKKNDIHHGRLLERYQTTGRTHHRQWSKDFCRLTMPCLVPHYKMTMIKHQGNFIHKLINLLPICNSTMCGTHYKVITD